MKGTGGGRWGHRAEIKEAANRARREADRAEAHILAEPVECCFCYKPTMGLVEYRKNGRVFGCCPTCWENVSEAYGAKGEKLWALA